MENYQELIPLQQSQRKKQTMLQKRLKAKQKAANVQACNLIKIQSKQQMRKQRNRCAAQKSRDRKKGYLQNLEEENGRLKEIIGRCQICSAEEERTSQSRGDRVNIEEEEIAPITQSPPTFVQSSYIREESENEDSSSNLSKFFWFGCFFVLVCMANYHDKDTNHRQLQEGIVPGQMPIFTNLNSLSIKSQKNTSIHSPKLAKASSALMASPQQQKCRQQCLQCLKDISNQTHGNLSLFGNQANTHTNTTNATNKLLFCKSKAAFFLKIYEALQDKQNKSSRQITRMLVKGKMLNDLMQQDCFLGEQINQEEEYLINFTVAILEMAPVKMSRSSRLSSHSD